MACHEIQSWTFCGLVGAFVDLGLAYLLLCGSTLAFFASKFLGIFGWQLPCPCNGFFGDPHGGKCLQRLLVDYPSREISSVQLSVKSKFPFDSIRVNDQECQLRVRLLGEAERYDGAQEMEGEASCSSNSDTRRRSQNFVVRKLSHNSELADGFGSMSSAALRANRTDFKGKGVVSQKPRSGLRRRRRAVADHRKSSPASFSDLPRLINQEVSHSPYSMSETGHEISEEGSVPMSSAVAAFRDESEKHTSSRLGEGNLHGFEVNGSFGESRVMEKHAPSAKELVRNVRDELGFNGDEKNVIRVLEQALEEEQAARAALYLELEKERSAAASAADEAMAMILRVQKEKASIEIEARQYLRMIEEKSAYDAEEMDILKEILLRREREKHFLENEVETYRQLILLNNEHLEGNVNHTGEISARRSTFSLDLNEDLEPKLQQISETIDKREIEKNVKTSPSCETRTFEGPSSFHALVKELPSSDWDKDANSMEQLDSRKVSSNKIQPHNPGSFDDCNQEIQEKAVVSMDEEPSVIQGEGQILETVSRLYELNSHPEHGLLEETVISRNEGHVQKDTARQCQGVEMKADPNLHGTSADQGGSDQHISNVETEPSIYDVHVIDDRSKLCKEEAREENQPRLTDTDSNRSRIHGLPFGTSRIDVSTDQPSTSRAATERDICRSCSDLTAELPPISNRHEKSYPFHLRRNSMSAVNNERLKLDTEVGWLRDKLRIVQEGRENLSFPMEHRESEKIQLQLLEDIAKQLKEIQQLTEPGKTVRQASLPPTSSKVCSKKRRCRSVSLGLHDST
ncbi:uncharacterized protein LOC122070951 [Macadamia integrifolia]|uniref:uncharacterized protein LOC122070951 n=1 Tax=Macadamia integrifolia TaxID=60698 RepID=UPI001C4E6795|nr:uncharacterized protein LOC122070951 [Macadamia integrifolia]XP_042491143.1 uncharacterized protein LOC122070951 [Macadamia integrifolia]